MLAIGGLAAYSRPGQELGPHHARQVWGYDIVTVSFEEISKRIKQARANATALQEAERQTAELLAMPNIVLATDRKFVVDTFLATRVFQDLMREKEAANLGVADCMTGLIPLLDTPPCLSLSLLNDEGFTASPSMDMCRSQMDIQIDGDWRKLTREMEGFQTVVCYGDYLREIGYALGKVGSIEWLNYSPDPA